MPDWLASSSKQTGESSIQKKFAFKAQFPSIAKPLLKMQGLNWLVVAISDETNDSMIVAINLKAFSLKIIYQHK
jgi:hypothetical protein